MALDIVCPFSISTLTSQRSVRGSAVKFEKKKEAVYCFSHAGDSSTDRFDTT